jgi:hypothetical protein
MCAASGVRPRWRTAPSAVSGRITPHDFLYAARSRRIMTA